MTKETNIEDFEHKDGLGDLLKEREKLEFSWPKTLGVVFGLSVIILASIFFIFTMSKRHLSNNISLQTNYSQQEEISQTKPLPEYQLEPEAAPAKVVAPETQVRSKAPKRSTKKVPTTAKHSYKLISGTYKNIKNAKDQVKKLKASGFDSFVRKVKRDNNSQFYQVQAGSFNDKQTALAFKTKLKKRNFDTYIIQIKQ